MAESLNPLQYGTVVGRFLVELGDSDDPDLTPDVYPVRGYLTFTPATSYANVKAAQPDPATVFPQTIIGVLDPNGYLCTVRVDAKGIPVKTMGGEYIPTERGIRMQASSDPSIIPTNWTWNVKFNLYFNNSTINYDSFNFTLDPFETVDLAYVKPVSQNGGIITITGPQGQKGEPGPKGDTGPAVSLNVGTVTTSPTGSPASVSVTGDVPNQLINFNLPQGPVGPSGGPIPSGGVANQLLRKNEAGGYEWFNPTYDKPTALGTGIDLDTITTPDMYHQSSNAGASGGLNYPAPFAGMLTVRAASSFIYQYYHVYATAGGNANKTFTRAKYGTAWTSWRELASTSPATTSSDGLLPSTDKSKLDSATALATANTLVLRDSTGGFSGSSVSISNDPTATTHGANKKYVDSKVTTLNSSITSLSTRATALEVKTRDSGWVNCPVTSGHSSQGSRGPQVRRLGSRVFLEWGVSNKGITTGNNGIATVPSEFVQPDGYVYGLWVSNNTNNSGGIMRVVAGGLIEIVVPSSIDTYYLAAQGYSWFVE